MTRKSKYEWKLNCWTGNYLARVTDKIRLIRIGHDTPCPNSGITFLYQAEDWGDYSLKYPIKGPWERTPAKAIRELKKEAASVVGTP